MQIINWFSFQLTADENQGNQWSTVEIIQPAVCYTGCFNFIVGGKP